MKRFLAAAVATILAAPAAWAQPKAVPLKVDGPSVVQVVQAFPCTVTAPPGASFYIWDVPPALTFTKAKNVLTVTAGVKGQYAIGVTALTTKIDFDTKSVENLEDRGEVTLLVGDVPVPDPRPPPPGPKPPAPIPGPGFRALIVYPAEGLTQMPAAQQLIIFGQETRNYLTARTPLGPDGRTREWRMYPDGVDTAGESQLWRDAMARPRASVPWVVLSNGATGYEGPLPATPAAFLDLAKKYAE